MKIKRFFVPVEKFGATKSYEIFILCLCCFIFITAIRLDAQTVIGGATPDPSAMLDVQSTAKGVLFPRMTTTERNNIASPASGLMIFNITTICLEINLGTSANPAWQSIICLGSINGLNCAGATLTGSLLQNIAASGVSVSVPYVGGNGGVYEAQSITSTGVTGLTATLSGGSFVSGSDNLSYGITGTPSIAGTASFALNIGGQSCTLNLPVQVPFSISCTDAIRKGEMQPGISYNSPSGVTLIVPYVGGTGAAHAGQTVTSTGVSTGFTATLSAGNFATGSGILTYEITGMGATGTATFALDIGGSSCSLDLEVKSCSAKINATDTKAFLCYNLGAYNTSASSSAPSWEVNGGYWRWGALAEAAAGPTGPGATEANSGAIDNWSSLPVGGNGAWVNASKTADDPCPAGFRVPSKTQWDGVINNNTRTNAGSGSWNGSATNYDSGKNFGSDLCLPATGSRSSANGTLSDRGFLGYYWSSTESGTSNAFQIVFSGGTTAITSIFSRTSGVAIRCIAE